MRKALSLIICLLPLLAVAQSNFFIVGKGQAFKNGDKIYLIYKEKGKTIFDSTEVKAGGFYFKRNVKEISLGYICKNENPMELETITAPVHFYTEPGRLVISASSLLENATISGTPINNNFQELNNSTRSYYRKSVEAAKSFDALSKDQQKDINNIARYRAQMKTINNEMVPVQLRFIAHHPNSYISLVTLRQIITNKDILPQVNAAYAKLDAGLKNSKEGKSLGDILTSLKKCETGTMAYQFTLPGVDGKPIALNEFKGKYTLIDFWASWCMPCREENPSLKLAYEKFKNKGFAVLGVSIENENEKNNWLSAINQDGLPWTQVLDGAPNNEKVKNLYGIVKIPSNVLLDPTGKIIAKDLKDLVLINKLKELLGNSD